jgi:hypothetical protein
MNVGTRRMAERPASARHGLKNPSDRACVSASRPARKESSEFTFGRKEPKKSELEEVRKTNADGRTVIRHRTVDSLGKLLRSGTITEAMHDAGRAFQRDFQFAGLDPIRARPIVLPESGGAPEFREGQLDARRRVHRALDALGGIGGPGGSCLWHVLGCGCSIREWAIRQTWNGRPSDQKEAKGILIAALGMVAGHYGYSDIGGRPLPDRRAEIGGGRGDRRS